MVVQCSQPCHLQLLLLLLSRTVSLLGFLGLASAESSGVDVC